jgi:hypothetical protein
VHGCQAETVGFKGGIKTYTEISNLQPNAILGTVKPDFYAVRTAVPYRIVQSLLGDTVKAQGNIV